MNIILNFYNTVFSEVLIIPNFLLLYKDRRKTVIKSKIPLSVRRITKECIITRVITAFTGLSFLFRCERYTGSLFLAARMALIREVAPTTIR